MKRAFYFAVLILLLTLTAYAQAPPPLTRANDQSSTKDFKIDAITQAAKSHFAKGMARTQEGNYTEARIEFDRAVDAILESGLNLNEFPALKKFYMELVDLIFEVEQKELRADEGVNKVEASSQVCKLKVVDAPFLRGFRLGMPFPKLEGSRYERTLKDDLEVGKRVLVIYYRSEGELESVRLEFLDNALARLEAQYHTAVEWRDVKEFALQVSESLRLPTHWEVDSYEARLDCDGFYVSTEAILGNYPQIKLEVLGYEDTVNKRLIELRERRRRTFKP
jgi:tetratricopeptide (TPR) repeat protein